MEKDYQVWELVEPEEKAACTRQVLESLPEWFGNAQAVSEYCQKVKSLPFWAAGGKGQWLGLLAGDVHYGRTGEIIVMGVKPGAHRQGLGRALYRQAEGYFRRAGCGYVIVKTLSDQVDFAPYAGTRAFYRGMGFAPLVTLQEMWDAENPCLIMMKSLTGQRDRAPA